MGPAIIDLASQQILCPNYDVWQIPMMLKEPTDDPLPLANALPYSNEMAQAMASANVKGVHNAVNSIMIRHVQPVIGVRANSVSTPGYGGFNSKFNPSFDPMVTMATKVASLDLEPGTFTKPGTVCAISNPAYYPSSKFDQPDNVPHMDFTRPGYYGVPNTYEQDAGFGHDSPRFGGRPAPFYNPETCVFAPTLW